MEADKRQLCRIPVNWSGKPTGKQNNQKKTSSRAKQLKKKVEKK
jgi:hypothetical protein